MTAIENPGHLPADAVLPLLRQLPTLGPTTTVILHGGCVFEFKGPFPGGSVAEGFYNLQGTRRSADDHLGFEGHLRLEAMTRVRFQDRPHRGRASYAFVFEDDKGRSLFKVFLGRDEAGEIIPEQLAFFETLRKGGALTDRDGESADPEH
jgi:putative heme utilization carrier protein HutX